MKHHKLISLAAAAALALAGCQSAGGTVGANSTGRSDGGLVSPLESMVQSAASSHGNESAEESTPQSSSQNAAESPPSESAAPAAPPTEGQEGEVSGSIFVLEDGRGLMLYGISYGLGRNYAKSVNAYKEALGANVNVYSMIVPTHITFYLPEKYSEVSDKELPHIEDVNAHLSGIIPVDVYPALNEHVNEEIFYRTDHHWTQLGAYYAAKKFAETALVPFDELSQYEKHEKGGYIGTFYGSSNNNPLIKNNPETFFWYTPKRGYTVTYYDTNAENGKEGKYFYDPDTFSSTVEWNLTYMAGNSRIAHINTTQKNGRKLMIIKDSYADSLAPCLFGSFEDIWIVDMRFCTTSAVQLAKDKGITDLLFCSNTFSATANLSHKPEEIM